MQSLTAGGMNFGRKPGRAAGFTAFRHGKGLTSMVFLGCKFCFLRKAVINCRTRLVFLKVDQSRHMNLSAVASSEKFTRVPVHREASGALTVPCSIHGQPGRLLVDTGAFVTTFPDTFLRSLGISSEPTRVSAHFPTGTTRRVSAAQINGPEDWQFQSAVGEIRRGCVTSFRLAARRHENQWHSGDGNVGTSTMP